VAEGPEAGTVKTVEEALANLMEAIALYLEKFGPPLPPPLS
jgi:predicted RNase H-like HicB family nuclease